MMPSHCIITWQVVENSSRGTKQLIGVFFTLIESSWESMLYSSAAEKKRWQLMLGGNQTLEVYIR